MQSANRPQFVPEAPPHTLPDHDPHSLTLPIRQ